MARWSRYDLIAIDEVGYVPLAEVGAEFLFQVIAERAERTAVVLTTNLPFSEWTQVIPNARLCKALLDRITDRAHILETGTESFPLQTDSSTATERSQSKRQVAVEMTVREKHGKPKPAFPPFPRPWKSRNTGGIPTFPPLRRILPSCIGKLKTLPKTATQGGPNLVAKRKREQAS
jgi:hypothetical protein